MTPGFLPMAAISASLGILAYETGQTNLQLIQSSRALNVIKTAPSIEAITDEKMIALLKTQGITMSALELTKYREKYNALTKIEQLRLMTNYTDRPIWFPMLYGGVVGLLVFCLMENSGDVKN